MNSPAKQPAHDLDIDIDIEPPEADTDPVHKGKSVEVILDDGRIFEVHVPRACDIRNVSDSSASVLAFCVKNADLTVECSGAIVLFDDTGNEVTL